ncbi:MAG: pyrimidine-nucleoside phosphorylase [Gemmatimonadota bacterium]|nr:MAG: pyrimidine-nucleoside phosphorylase [Gemmatimonadota bacterium]
MIPSRIIETKREGRELSTRELQDFLGGYLAGDIPDYQMAAFLMAVVFQGLTPAELDTTVDLMLHSGRVLDHSHLPAPAVDKHSTGGVGDKVSIVLAPLVAELGVYVPMMSGRGLGHSGGTLDKLESIPGFRTDLPLDEFSAVLERLRCAMIGQTAEIAPLDERLYSLRDATGTVPAIPLISASIMSKKLAEGLRGLVLDIKVGAGAFLPDVERAVELAQTMVGVGEARGVRCTALLTRMDRPLGRAVGNALEMAEAIDCLKGEGPADLIDVTVALAAEMLVLGERFEDRTEAASAVRDLLATGGAVDRFRRLVDAQGGDPAVVDDPSLLPAASVRETVYASVAGVVQAVSPRPLGYGVIELGGGRTRLGQDIDASVGFTLSVTVGDRVDAGDPLGVVHASDEAGAERGAVILGEAVALGHDDARAGLPLVSHRVTTAGIEDLSEVG